MYDVSWLTDPAGWLGSQCSRHSLPAWCVVRHQQAFLLLIAMAQTPDLLFRNVQLFDGSGADPVRGDLAVTNGQISAIGSNLPTQASQVIDGTGLALMPGIIDSHTHFDA